MRSANIEATLNRLLALGALPIVNENDTVSTAEIAVGEQRLTGRHCGRAPEGGFAGAADGH